MKIHISSYTGSDGIGGMIAASSKKQLAYKKSEIMEREAYLEDPFFDRVIDIPINKKGLIAAIEYGAFHVYK